MRASEAHARRLIEVALLAVVEPVEIGRSKAEDIGDKDCRK